jgi:hypothetical protein
MGPHDYSCGNEVLLKIGGEPVWILQWGRMITHAETVLA